MAVIRRVISPTSRKNTLDVHIGCAKIQRTPPPLLDQIPYNKIPPMFTFTKYFFFSDKHSKLYGADIKYSHFLKIHKTPILCLIHSNEINGTPGSHPPAGFLRGTRGSRSSAVALAKPGMVRV